MVSLQAALAALAALASFTSASPARNYLHRRMVDKAAVYGYGYNDTIPRSGTGVPLTTGAPDYTVKPTKYMTESTSYITVTYTLGDGRAITKTITKMAEYETTVPETTHLAPTGAPSVIAESVKPVRTSTFTKYVTLRYGETTTTEYVDYEPSAPVIAPEEIQSTLTVTSSLTSTAVIEVTSTIAPVVPSWDGGSASATSTVLYTPPYGNSTVGNDKTTTRTRYPSVIAPIAGPTGTGGLSYYI